ncbi:hypothetical protein ACTFIV_002370 [Dictyostelium citrinum]
MFNDDIDEELRKIQNLLENNYISDEEFKRRKNDILGFGNSGNPPTVATTPSYNYNDHNNYNTYDYNSTTTTTNDYYSTYNNNNNNNNNYYSTPTTNVSYSLSTSDMEVDVPVIPILNSESSYDYNNNNNNNNNNYNNDNNTPTYTYTNNNNNRNNNNNNKNNNNNSINKEIENEKERIAALEGMYESKLKEEYAKKAELERNVQEPRRAAFAEMFEKRLSDEEVLSKSMEQTMDLNIVEVEGGETQPNIKFKALSPNPKKVYIDLKGWIKESYGNRTEPSVNADDWKQQKMKQQNILRNRLVWDNVNGLNASEKNCNIKLVGGCDISFPKESKVDAVASIVILEYPSCRVVYESYKMVKLTEPYVAGYLAFREVPHFLDLWNAMIKKYPQFKPDLMILDGNGINHQRSVGAACHFGIIADVPTIGVAKTLLVAKGITPEFIEEGLKKSNTVEMIDRNDKNRIVGHAFRNNDGNIIYVSPGHKMDAHTSLQLVRKCLTTQIGKQVFHRPIPEPTFQADHLSRVFINLFYKNFK